MAALRQCKRMSPFYGQRPAGLKPGDLLNALRGSKEPLFHIGAGAKGVIRNDHYAKLDPAQVSVLYFVPASADPVEERPFMAALRQCKRMSPFRARGLQG